MKSTLIGYFPKRTKSPPNWLIEPKIDQVCSVSECISMGPKDWISLWKHNTFFLFDTTEIAQSIIETNISEYDIYAYKQYPFIYENGKYIEHYIECKTVKPMESNFLLLGYDSVSRTYGNAFAHSPLSCCNYAHKLPTNRFCLLNSLSSAKEAAKLFSIDNPEPGPYYVVEVYREKKGHLPYQI